MKIVDYISPEERTGKSDIWGWLFIAALVVITVVMT